MKKILCFFLVLCLIGLLSGCKKESNKEFVKICNAKSKSNEGQYKVESSYKLFGKDNIVTRIEKEEVIISEDKETLKYFEEYLGVSYSNLNEKYGGYKNKITKKEDRIVSNTTIDLKKISLKEYINDNEVIKNYIDKNNNFTKDNAISFYEEMLLAKCK